MAESSDLWDELEQTPLHYPVEQDIVWEIDLSEWLLDIDPEDAGELVLYTKVVCGCNPKWAYAVGHELEEGYENG